MESFSVKLFFIMVLVICNCQILKSMEVTRFSNEQKINVTIHEAVHRGWYDNVREMLDQNKNLVHARHPNPNFFANTPLHVAAFKGYSLIVKLLLNEYKANPMATNNRDETPLHIVGDRNAETVIRDLVQAGAKVDAATKFGRTPLHRAAFIKKFEMLKLLVELGANVKAKDKNEHTILHSASCGGDCDIIKFLIEKGAQLDVFDGNGTSPLDGAILNHNVDAAILLWQCKPIKYNGKRQTPLFVAVCANHLGLGRFFIEQKIPVNAQDKLGETALHKVAKTGSGAFFDLLVENGADVNVACSMGIPPLYVAVKHGNNTLVQKFITAKADYDFKTRVGATSLIWAAKVGNAEAAAMLIEAGAKVNALDNNKQTPLHIAAYNGKSAVIATLLQAGADKNIRNKSNETARQRAQLKGHAACVRLLDL